MKYLITKLLEPDWTGRCNPNSGLVCYSDYKFQGASEQIMTINLIIMSVFFNNYISNHKNHENKQT